MPALQKARQREVMSNGPLDGLLLEPGEDGDEVDFNRNPYSCDFRADKSNSACNKLTSALKAALLVGQAATLLYYWAAGGCDTFRCAACVFCGLAFLARVLLQLLYFWARRIPWAEVILEAAFIVPLSLVSLVYGARQYDEGWWTMPVLGLVLFLGGTYVNLVSEFQRYAWKQQDGNQGKLYSGGLLGQARHINYTGEVSSFIGFALVSGQWYNLWVPVCMGLGMVVWSQPELDWYLKHRYGPKEHARWLQQVPHKFVPGLWCAYNTYFMHSRLDNDPLNRGSLYSVHNRLDQLQCGLTLPPAAWSGYQSTETYFRGGFLSGSSCFQSSWLPSGSSCDPSLLAWWPQQKTAGHWVAVRPELCGWWYFPAACLATVSVGAPRCPVTAETAAPQRRVWRGSSDDARVTTKRAECGNRVHWQPSIECWPQEPQLKEADKAVGAGPVDEPDHGAGGA
eukprot:49490_2